MFLAHGDKERDIFFNSWEGVYFDINQKGMDQMMADIHSMGGELFVMDDGWFGKKYPRITDNYCSGRLGCRYQKTCLMALKVCCAMQEKWGEVWYLD